MRKVYCLSITGLILCGCSGEPTSAAPPKASSSPVVQATPTESSPTPTGPSFKTRKIAVAGKEIVVEIADTEARRQHGLMYRQSLPENAGMLFIFDYEQTLRFWMKNTYIPLSIAYIDQKKKIIDIQDMEPASDMEITPRTYPSSGPAMYALEMNKGWFAKNKVKIGDTFVLR